MHTWIKSVLRTLFGKARLDRELDEELDSYMAMLADEKVRAGLSPAEATRQVRIELGGAEQVKEKVRERRLGAGLDALFQDIRFALRTLARDAGLTLAILVILGVGIGANTALFTTVDTVLIRPLPYSEPDRLVIGLKTMGGAVSGPVSRVDYFDYRRDVEAFDQLALLTTFTEQFTVTGGGDPELVQGYWVTWNLFPTLGVAPEVGRGFLPEEEARGEAPVVIVSHGFAQRRFGGAEDAMGATLVLSGDALTVVGVMPPGFRFMYDADVWRLIDRDGPYDTQRDSHSHWIVGRLKPSATLVRAQTEVDAVATHLAAEYPSADEGKGLMLSRLQDYLVRNVQASLLLLMGTAAFVLLVACSNVAGLLLARGERRVSEMAMRTALGASRRRLIRQLLTESVTLTVGAGLLGVAVAYLVHHLLTKLLPVWDLGIHPPALNGPALAFTVLVSVGTGLLVGVLPALRTTSAEPVGQLRSDGHGTVGVRSGRLRGGLVVLQVALSVILLVGSGLLAHSMARLVDVDLGFDPANLLTGQVQIQATEYPSPEERTAFFTSLLEEVEALPSVETATLSNRLPIVSRWQDWSIRRSDQPPPPPQESFSAMARWVPPGYFKTMGIPVLEGRDISKGDGAGSPYVVVVSRKVAETLFGHADPLGHMVNIGDWRDCRVVGVVGDARINTLRGSPDPAYYMSMAQMGSTRLQIAVRTAGDPLLLVRPLQDLLRHKDPNVLFAQPRAMSNVVEGELTGFRTILFSLGLFAALAVFLAATGIYGILAYDVGQRRGELGLRLALGASEVGLVAMVVRQGMAMVALGLALGLAAAYPATLAMRHLVYETALLDPTAYVGAAVLLGAVALLASYGPARRASKRDAAELLRTA
ncbi:MAG: ABC transporter permease [Gemmatimonadetes bacterium]|nr:ABC transporter permease [Gemmatimonadota bacterium]